MTRKPLFWIILVLIFVGSILFIVNYFSSAYPIVNLKLQMDREDALQRSRDLAKKYDWGPDDFEQTAVFHLDREVQNFVELEQGGTEAFAEMLEGKLYSPYIWKIRHYKPDETNETMIRFTPQGEPYGFREKLAEDQPGASLPSDSALVIAREGAVNNYSINFAEYDLVERSHEVKPGGRKDHTFVFERNNASLDRGKYRLRLRISGEKFTELTHFVKVPEAFSRNYSEMRSTNQTISAVAMVAMVILYLVGGCIIGLFLLMKQNWVLWRKALIWGGIVALFQVLAQINQWPLLWMNYDTALSSQGFVIQQIVQLVVIFIAEFLLLSLTFMAAESLTRKAFPEHVQFWKVWSPKVASSPGIWGRTIGGYLAVAIFLAFDIGLYFFATRVLGWWVPADTLFEPNIMATYFPWLSSIANSLHAGFWEECLFRAVPIAGAALLGDRYGKRKWWIVGAFVLQAFIFGGGHANYPMQPAYARVVELIIPSIAFGLLYLYLGLLPAIILHYAYDVVFMAMPLFAASTPGIWLDRIMVIILTFIPLIIVIWRTIQAGKISKIPADFYNAAWQPDEIEGKVQVEPEEPEVYTLQTGRKRYFSLIIAGIVGLLVWGLMTNFNNRAPRVETTRHQAEEAARQHLIQNNIEVNDSIKVLTSFQIPLSRSHRFIWQESGSETYDNLLGTYLSPPLWRVRFARFTGDVAKRAEEYRAFIQDGEIINVHHKLPESYPGVELSEDSARAIAYSILREKYQLDPGKLKEVAAKPAELPDRKDWTFTYADTLNYRLSSGEPRIVISIAGAEVNDTYRKIHIPEEWQRQQRERNSIHRIIGLICGIILFILLGVAAVTAIIRWSKKQFPAREFLLFFLFLVILGIIQFVNRLPAIMAHFNTAQPFNNQLFIMIISPIIGIFLLSAAIALINGLIMVWKPEQNNKLDLISVLTGLSIGFLVAGSTAFVAKFWGPDLKPLWAKYNALQNYLPVLATGISPIQSYIIRATTLLLIFSALSRFTNNWTKHRILFAMLIVLVAIVLTGFNIATISSWIISGLATGIIFLFFYVFIIRFRLDLIPLAISGYTILFLFRELLFNAYPGAIIGNIMAIFLVLFVAVFWSSRLNREV